MRLATLRLWCRRAIEGGWLLITLAVPLAFDAGSVHPFEPAKVAMLRTVVAFMVVAWLIGAGVQGYGRAEERGNERAGEQGGRDTHLVSCILHRASCILHPVPALILILALLYIAATICSISPRISLWGSYQWRQGTYTFLCLLALFVLVAGQLRVRTQLNRLVTATLYASAVVSGYGLLQFAGLDPIPWERPSERAFATLGHPNFLGLYVAMTIPLAVARLLAARNWVSRGLYAGLLLAQAGCLLATFSRSAWLGVLAAGVVFALLAGIRGQRTRWVTAGLGLVTLALVAFAALAYADPSGWASSGPLEPVHSLLRGKSATTAIRVLEWEATARLIAARPVLGTGPESFEVAFQAVYPPALTVYGGARATGGRAHNDFLDWTVNAGLLGLAAYLALVVVTCWCGWRAAQRAPRDESLVMVALIAGVVAYLVANQFSFGTAATLSTLWLSLGLLAALPLSETGSTPLLGDHDPLKGRQGRARAAAWRLLASVGLYLLALVFVVGTNVVPLLADAHAKAGMHGLTNGDWPTAIAAYERAVALQPDQDRYHALLASAHLAQAVNGAPASFPAAEATLDRAITLSSTDEAHWLALGDVRRYWGETISEPVHLDRAIVAYQEAQRLSPTDPEPLIKIGQVLVCQGRPADAVRAYQAALVLDSLNVSAYTHLALAYEALERLADAAEARRQAAHAAKAIARLISKR
jgi:O-antigen ligase